MAFLAKTPRRCTALALSLLALACGDSGGETTQTTQQPTTQPTSSTETGTGTDATTGTTGTTGTPTTGLTGGETSTGTLTGGPTSTGEGPTTGTTAGETSTGETGTTSPGETTGTTGDPLGAECEIDSDCEVYTDCCTCDATPKDGPKPTCDIMECLVPACETLDIGDGQAVCRFGRCTFEKQPCNPLGVLCDGLPPDCPQGQIPTLAPDKSCWTGQCAPAEACDWAPDCSACVDDEDPLVCVFKAQKGAYHVCEPKPVACGDTDEIDCECGAEICESSPPHTLCHDQQPGIVCECPNC